MIRANKGKVAQEEVFGEVIFSSNEMVIAQSYKDELIPSKVKEALTLGSIVKIASSYDNSYLSYGLVAKINNTSLDQLHKPSALGLAHSEIAELQPQVYELLRKELEIHLFAYIDSKGLLIRHPPSEPMMIHDFVKRVHKEELTELTSDISSLAMIVKKKQLKPELLINPIVTGFKFRNNDTSYLITIGKILTSIFSDETISLLQLLKHLQESCLAVDSVST